MDGLISTMLRLNTREDIWVAGYADGAGVEKEEVIRISINIGRS